MVFFGQNFRGLIAAREIAEVGLSDFILVLHALLFAHFVGSQEAVFFMGPKILTQLDGGEIVFLLQLAFDHGRLDKS